MGTTLTTGRLAIGFLAALLNGGLPVASAPSTTESRSELVPTTIVHELPVVATTPTRPEPLPIPESDPLAAVVVEVLTDHPCSGTALADLPIVVTAAHCVLDDNGDIVQNAAIFRGYQRYSANAVVVDRTWWDHKNERNDVALLLLDRPLPVGATLAQRFPTGDLRPAGFQPDKGLQGCTVTPEQVHRDVNTVRVPCGLIPGASGGGLYSVDGDRVTLAGVLSTVTMDHTVNGFVPLHSVTAMIDGRLGAEYPLRALPTPRTNTLS
jgi:hypothetical protein